MAEITPDTITRASAGDHTLTIADFANTADDQDTWVTAPQGMVSVMLCQADQSTGTANTSVSTRLIAAGASFSGTTVTLHISEPNTAVTLWVLSKS